MPPKEFDIILAAVNSYIGGSDEADWDTYNCACFIFEAIDRAGYEIVKKGEIGKEREKKN